MRKLSVPGLAAAALLLAGPAWAFRTPENNAAWPTPHQQEVRTADSTASPYTMTYSDEAAQRLGLADGRWNAFETHSGDGSTLKGGFDTNGAVLRLQW